MQTYELTYTVDTIDSAVVLLASLFNQCQVFAFEGGLGAGKTTLIKKLLAHVGVKELIASPTFTYVSIYKLPDGIEYYHFDLYRLQSLKEFLQAGFDEYLFKPNSWAFIEWPDVIMPLLEANACMVSLEYEGLQARKMTISRC